MRGLLSAPALGASNAEIREYYADSSNGTTAIVWLQVLVVSTIAFLWFVGVLLPHSPAHGKARLHSESEVASSMRNTVSAYLHTASTTTRTQTDSAH